MGKYLVRFESMDGNEALDERFAEGIECDGFCVLARVDDKNSAVAIHDMSVDMMSDVIKCNYQVLSAAILAKAKRDVIEVSKDGEHKEMLRELFGKMM